MPTIHSLRAAFDARADDAPSASDLLASLPPVEKHSPWARRGAIAAGVASAAAVTVVAVVASNRTPAPTHTTGAPPPVTGAANQSTPVHHVPQPLAVTATRLQYSFALGQVPGYELSLGQIDPDAQVADVSTAGAMKSTGDIRVYSEGIFDPSEAQRGTPLTVHGHQGYWALIGDPDTGDSSRPSSLMRKYAVVWEYATDAWAVVQGDWAGYPPTHVQSAEQTQLRIANAVDTERSTTARLPFRLTYLPDGLVAQNMGSAPDASQAELGLTDGGARDPSMSADTPGYGDAVSVQANVYDQTVDLRQVDAKGNLHVNHQGGYELSLGHPVAAGPGADRAFQAADGAVTVLYPDRYVTVYYTGARPARVPNAELLDIAQGLRVSPHMLDMASWFDALDATP